MGIKGGALNMDVKSAMTKAAEKLGYSNLREKQREAMKEFSSGRDIFLTVPTGYRKSIVYGALPYAFELMNG